jgi:hypothetical protein
MQTGAHLHSPTVFSPAAPATSIVSLSEFTSGLFSSGHVIVSRRDLPPPHSQPELPSLITTAFETTLADLPGGNPSAPDLVCQADVATTALQFLYRLCQALADRSLTDADVQAISESMPRLPETAEDILSADLALRHLPGVYRLARSISETDPLIICLERVATSFPFSSVGIPTHLPPDLSLIQLHPALWSLYLDRILEAQDETRVAHPAVLSGIRDALGMHTTLAPRLAAKITLLGT